MIGDSRIARLNCHTAGADSAVSSHRSVTQPIPNGPVPFFFVAPENDQDMSTSDSPRRMPLHIQILIAMVIGSIIGIAVNPGDTEIASNNATITVIEEDAVKLVETSTVDSAETILEQRFESKAAFSAAYPKLGEILGEQSEATVEIQEGKARFQQSMSGMTVSWQRLHEQVPATTTLKFKSVDEMPAFWKTTFKSESSPIANNCILLAKMVGDFFLRLLKMVTVPLILTSLITGVTGLGSQGNFGQMFSRTIGYYFATSLLAIVTGLILVNLISPGVGAILPGGGSVMETADQTLLGMAYEQLNRLIPTNPFAAVASGEFLSIISFAIIFGTFINLVGGEHGKRLSDFFAAAFEVMMKMTSWVIGLAPLGVAAFMIYATATQGFSVFGTLALYMITVAAALLFHAVVVLPIILKVFARRSPLEYFRSLSPALLTAFSTASSNATLPLTMKCVEDRAGISNRTSSFVLPLGATINMDGTALYEVVAVLFIAQATPGFDLSLAQQITVAFTALLASVGAAGIPHAGLVMMAIVLQAVGLPLEAQGIIIAVDRVLDMCRTSVNVWSDSCGCAVVEKLAGTTTESQAEAT